jgi:aspartate kinase
MKVFKFGGASVKDAQGLKRVAEIVSSVKGDIIVVVSAMGKTTNALEKLVPKIDATEAEKRIKEIEEYHFAIAEPIVETIHESPLRESLQRNFKDLRILVKNYPFKNYDERYDAIVSIGELISSHIISEYLNGEGLTNVWVDARKVIMTDDTYRDAKVDFNKTAKQVKSSLFTHTRTVTQGFIGFSQKERPTTLGREGSDYTAAIIAYCANAESVTIWKDVPGVLNADPKKFKNTVKIDHLSYQDAIELAYYGATVMHPKTIKPLQNKNIPLFVKPFMDWKAAGTLIDDGSSHLPVPCFISKPNQVLLSLSTKDFSFIAEENISHIFNSFARYKVKVNMMQLSAINFSVCFDNDTLKAGAIHESPLLESFKGAYRVLYNDNTELFTIRYYDQTTIKKIIGKRKVLLEQRSRYTVQLLLK